MRGDDKLLIARKCRARVESLEKLPRRKKSTGRRRRDEGEKVFSEEPTRAGGKVLHSYSGLLNNVTLPSYTFSKALADSHK